MYGKYTLFYESPKNWEYYAHVQTVCTRSLLWRRGGLKTRLITVCTIKRSMEVNQTKGNFFQYTVVLTALILVSALLPTMYSKVSSFPLIAAICRIVFCTNIYVRHSSIGIDFT